MVVIGGDRPSWCKGSGGGGSERGRVDGSKIDKEVGDDEQELKTGDIT